MRQLLAAFVIHTCALIQGCGQTGPLYMPDEPEPRAEENDSPENSDPSNSGPTPIN